jgi:hypothetical protein
MTKDFMMIDKELMLDDKDPALNNEINDGYLKCQG